MNDIQNTWLMVLSFGVGWGRGWGFHYTFTLHVSEIGISKIKWTSDNSKKNIMWYDQTFSHTCVTMKNQWKYLLWKTKTNDAKFEVLTAVPSGMWSLAFSYMRVDATLTNHCVPKRSKSGSNIVNKHRHVPQNRWDVCSSLHDIASRKPTEGRGQQWLQHSTVQHNNERLKGDDLLRKE